MNRAGLVAFLLASLLVTAARANPAADRIGVLLDAGRLDEARAQITAELDAGSTSNELLYQRARAEAQPGGDRVQAQASLVAAVAAGFTDFFRLARDPMLAGLREDPAVRTILDHRATLLADRAAADARAIERAFPVGYVFRRDAGLRLQFACAQEDAVLDQLIAEARALRGWVHTEFWDAPADPELDPWVTVILPTPEDFVRLVGVSGVGGYYDPETRRAVVSDLGPSFRHELMHVFHTRRLERLGQRRPHWFTEGLASLPEDLDPRADGFVPVGSWRTDIARRRLAAGRLATWADLFTQDRDRFVGHRPKAQYAQARAAAMFFFDTGAMRDLCDAFAETADPIGLEAVARATGEPVARTERRFRGWLATMRTGEPDARELSARFGIELTAGRGAGPAVTRVTPGTAAGRAKLRRRDVILAVDGRPVRTITEFWRAASAGPVTVLVRRGRAQRERTLVAPPAGGP